MNKKHATPPALVASIAFVAAQAIASTHASAMVGTNMTPDPATQSQRFTATEAAGTTSASSRTPHLFPVRDSKGLLLTCIAPEIDTNIDTDVFQDCMLAPGRTLDDVMHTFVGAIHYVQNQQTKERSEDVEEKPDQKPERKP